MWLLLAVISVNAAVQYVGYVEFACLKGEALLRPADKPGDGPTEVALRRLGIYFQMIYFTVVTVTTVGFGDIVPSNLGGQLLVLLLQVQGFLLLIVVFALLTNELVREDDSAAPPSGSGP